MTSLPFGNIFTEVSRSGPYLQGGSSKSREAWPQAFSITPASSAMEMKFFSPSWPELIFRVASSAYA
jgi:hypothetical protein